MATENATTENATTLFLTLAALGTIAWGYGRARAYGKAGLFAWLQSVVILAPWLLFFGLFALGVAVNLTVILFLFVGAVGVYIYLGWRLRQMAEAEQFQNRITQMLRDQEQEESPGTPDPQSQGGDLATPQEAPPEAPSGDRAAAPRPRPPLPQGVSLMFPPVPPEDLQKIKGIFGIDTFFPTETIPYQDGVIFKGNLRGEPEASYQRMAEKLTQTLADRYRLYLVEDGNDRPTAIVLPSTNGPQPYTPSQKFLAVVIALVTLFTALERGGLQYGFDILEAGDRWPQALPIGLGLAVLLVAHELGHWVLAQRYQVRLGFPFFIPSWQMGSFGAITRFESILPNRSVLFDIAFAGPGVAGILALVCLGLGLVLPPGPWGVTLPTPFFQGSLLVGSLARLIMGSQLQAATLTFHPVFVVGWLGLVITALNLIPLGQLDGGRIVQAIYGRKIAGRTTIVAIVFLIIAALNNPIALYWGILAIFLQRQGERPALEELTEPDDRRALWGLVALLLTVLTLLPFTPSLALRWGIGVP